MVLLTQHLQQEEGNIHFRIQSCDPVATCSYLLQSVSSESEASSRVQWRTTVTPALGKPNQEGHRKFDAVPEYM